MVVGFVNVLKLFGKFMLFIKVVVNGVGVVGIVIIKFFYYYGVCDIVMCDLKGVIYEGCLEGMNDVKNEVVKFIN